MKLTSLGLLILLLLAPSVRADEQTLRTFDVCWKRVRSNFYDDDHHGVDWEAMREQYRPRADAAAPGAELHAVLQRMLAELKSSHVTLMPADVYQAMMAELTHRPTLTAGVMLEIVAPGRYHVRAQYEEGPGEKAGLRLGDRVLRVNGVAPERSAVVIDAGYDPALPGPAMCFLRVEEGRSIRLEVQSDPAGRTRRTTILHPERTNAVEACRASAEVVEVDGFKLGKIHVWYCSRGVVGALHDALTGELKDCDALVLDLRGRGGYGDVADSILRTFQAPRRASGWNRLFGAREGKGVSWTRPVVFLTDGRTRSAKEILAQRIRTGKVGTLVGERTEGAVLGAGFFPLPDGTYLELAVMDVPVDGVRLEGVGVAPHVPVAFDYVYGAGRDPILETGFAAAWILAEEWARAEGPD